MLSAPPEQGAWESGPKCKLPPGLPPRALHRVDFAHPEEDRDRARRKTEHAVDDAIHEGHYGVKIIRGYGSTSGRSVIGPQTVSLIRSL